MSERLNCQIASTEGSEGARDGSAPDSFDAALREIAHVPTAKRKSDSVLPGSLVAGKFRVERSLGQGGMGVVYAVRHELTKHRRALKLLHPERSENPEVVQRFLDEASAAGRTGSPHLVETYDAGTLPTGQPYLVMELLEGLTFAELIEQRGVMSPELACELVAQAAEGMAAAHQANIIHRDLKPDNLFIVQKPEGPFVKILDFGISKFSNRSLAERHITQEGAIFGTPAYMAPEQMQNAKDVDERADVFALGAVLFECLGGESPYQAGTLNAIVARLISGESTSLESLREDLSPELHGVVRRAIAADPTRRTPNARALVDELAPFRRRDTPSYRALASPESTDDLNVEPASARTYRAREPSGDGANRRVQFVLVVTLAVAAAGGLAWWMTPTEKPERSLSTSTSDADGNLERNGATADPHATPPPGPLDAEPQPSNAADIPGPPAALEEPSRDAKRGRGSTKKAETAEPRRTRAQELGLSEKNPFLGDAP